MKKNKISYIAFFVLFCMLLCSCEKYDTEQTSVSLYESTVTSDTVLSEESADDSSESSEISSEKESTPSSKAASSKKAESKAQSSKTSSAPKEKKETQYPYFLSVNRKQNVVTVYKKDKNGEYTVPFKAFVCSCGKDGGTPKGTYKTQNKYEWRALVGGVYGQYATRITGQILFHSVPYFKRDKGTLEYEEYNKLGTAASLGCVRLTVADAKWIYDNCDIGTTVKIYDGDEKLPLGKPTAEKIDVKSENRGWDPTDPDSANPWKNTPASSSSQTPSETSFDASSEQEAGEQEVTE